MKKFKRNHNPNLIKEKHSYTFAEISEDLKVHPRTVQSWRKQGLKVLDETSRPYYVYGEDLKKFLIVKRQKQKHPLKTGEFFCIKCQSARKSRPEDYSFEITSKKLGKTSKQAFIRGICEVCGQPLRLFSSDKKIEELIKMGWHFPVILRGEGGEPIQGFPTISILNPDLHTGHKNLNIGHDNTGT
jgi:hypothetical protein